MKHELIIIGGGASGILAAINAKNLGLDVSIIEGNNRIAKKLLTTGNGRCNITNKCTDFNRFHSENSEFFYPVLDSFTFSHTIDFFEQLGLPIITLEDGKMYPMSLQASSVVDILKASLEEREIPTYLNTKVTDIKAYKNGFKIFTNLDETYECRKLILSCGGKS
ncbi:MAG: NAD(P)/FAD-dependent oxidoreductase, partial [Clostridium sp.]|nr:NAD(P)/FAD-dependent oxidoreductase [Clostridium sp.]